MQRRNLKHALFQSSLFHINILAHTQFITRCEMVIRYKCKNCGTILYEFKEAIDPNISNNWKERIIVKPATSKKTKQ